MKTTSIFVLLFTTIFFVKAQKSIVPLKTSLKEVTVFLTGVQIERSGSINLAEGNSVVVASGLPADIIEQTIQVSGKGDFTILSVSKATNFLIEQDKPKEIQSLEDSIQKLRDMIAEKNAQLSVYSQEESFILANKEIGGENTGVSIASLKEASDFIRNRLMDIKNKQLSINKQIAEIQKKISKYENQLNERNAKRNMPTSEVLISVWTDKPTQAVFTIKYLSYAASWYPSYDLKVKNTEKPIQLVYKANVQQRTGEDWSNIKMTLSTANPFQSATKPVFNPWYLTYYQPPVRYNDGYEYKKSKAMLEQAPAMARTETAKAEDLPDARSAYEYSSQQTNLTTVEFTINKPYTIPSNGQAVAVEMTMNELPAQYEYFSFPKANPSAYLLAKVTGWESLNMIPGDVHLFFENTYIGKSQYNGTITTDTLDFSLGQDKSISVKREKIKEYSSKKIIGLNQRQSIGFKITIRNNKSVPVVLNLFDQLPLSTNKEIEIEKIETSNAQVDETTGAVYWRLQLKPGESKELTFIYAVKYPKERIIILE